jgi:probable HAF family extracellular repeat protein
MNHGSLAGRMSWKFAFALLFLPFTAAAQTYTVTDLGTLGGSTSTATGINASGQITGFSSITTSGGTINHVFLYSDGKMTDLGTLGGSTSAGAGINASGQVAGNAYNASGVDLGFFTNSSEQLTSVGVLGGKPGFSEAQAINDLGEVVGVSSKASGAADPFLYSHGTLTDLGNLGGNQEGELNYALGINNTTQVVGYSWVTDNEYRPFLWQSGQIMDLGTLGDASASAVATGINDEGQVTGWSYLNDDFGTRAFIWNEGQMSSLGTLSASANYSFGNAINNSGDVVGYGTTSGNLNAPYHAFIYRNGKMHDLNGLILAHSGWVLTFANGINDSGQIVGQGTIKGEQHAFLLTPQLD